MLNMMATAKLVAAGALARTESRGAHCRTDYPYTDNIGHRTMMTLVDADRIAAQNAPKVLPLVSKAL